MIRDAVQPALDSAGLAPGDIDGIFVGHFNAGFVGQDFTAPMGILCGSPPACDRRSR
jgi:acetyl-CoA C-acetyltransferase